MIISGCLSEAKLHFVVSVHFSTEQIVGWWYLHSVCRQKWKDIKSVFKRSNDKNFFFLSYFYFFISSNVTSFFPPGQVIIYSCKVMFEAGMSLRLRVNRVEQLGMHWTKKNLSYITWHHLVSKYRSDTLNSFWFIQTACLQDKLCKLLNVAHLL